ncbi:UDPGT domain-containing protein [Cephalotus follicularis]|uniref:UDPGT domain-containing protein n=1 Tax=Cephalotus follicularis TaxID=3775 RepID=A0A1Q3DA25_CEPFO|nr:UDPGT domain-containing protein [Cephalotus follicularis]
MRESPRHVAVLAFPFATHAAPLLALVRRISKAAPAVKFSFFSTAQSNAANFARSHDDENEAIKPYNVHDGLPEVYVFKGNPHEPVSYFLEATPGNFRSAMEAAVAETGLEITCLMTDAFYWFAAEMAEAMGVPWVPLWTAGPRALFVHVDAPVIRQHMGINVEHGLFAAPEDRTLDFLEDFATTRVADLPDGIISGCTETPMLQMLDRVGVMIPRATAVAMNSFEELDPTVINILKSRFKKLLNVGPFILTSPSSAAIPDEHGCLQWLDKQKPASVAYISFGSVITPPPNEVEALADAMEASGFPFLWSFRGNAEEKLPKGFIERNRAKAKVVPWAPQLQVLLHSSVGVFVTHCGWNSILESMNGGVPMICRSFFGEQPLNKRTVEVVWKTGLGVDQFTKDGTMKALKVILSSEEGKKMRERIGVQRELAVNAVQSDGSSTENFKTLVQTVTN